MVSQDYLSGFPTVKFEHEGKQYESYPTVGDGSCGLHAFFGGKDQWGQFYCPEARKKFVDKLEQDIKSVQDIFQHTLLNAIKGFNDPKIAKEERDYLDIIFGSIKEVLEKAGSPETAALDVRVKDAYLKALRNGKYYLSQPELDMAGRLFNKKIYLYKIGHPTEELGLGGGEPIVMVHRVSAHGAPHYERCEIAGLPGHPFNHAPAALSSPSSFAKIRGELDKCLAELESEKDKGTAEDALKALEENLKDNGLKEEREALQKLEMQIKKEEEDYRNLSSYRQKLKDSFDKIVQDLKAKLQQSLDVDRYFEGPGAFDEMESDSEEDKKQCDLAFDLLKEGIKEFISVLPEHAEIIMKNVKAFVHQATVHTQKLIFSRQDDAETLEECTKFLKLLGRFKRFRQDLVRRACRIYRLAVEQKEKNARSMQEKTKQDISLDFEAYKDDLKWRLEGCEDEFREFVGKKLAFIDFGKRLGQRELNRALDDAFVDPEKIIKELLDAYDDLDEIFDKLDAMELVDLEDVQEAFSTMIGTINRIIEAIDAQIDGFSDLAPDERDSNDLFIDRVLNRDLEEIDLARNESYELHESWAAQWKILKEYYEKSKEYKARHEASEKDSGAKRDERSFWSQKKLIKALNHFRSPQFNPSVLAERRKEVTAKYDSTKVLIDRTIRLIRKERLAVAVPNAAFSQLEKRRKEMEEKVVAAGDREEQIDFFIEWSRYNKKIQGLENEARGFIEAITRHMVTRQLDPAVDYVLTSYGPRRDVRGMGSRWQHPLDSPLVQLVSALAKDHIGNSKYDKLLYVSSQDRKLSKFEEGVLKLTRKSIDDVVSRSFSVIQDAQRAVKDASSLLPIPGTHTNVPGYYKEFALGKLEMDQVGKAGDDAFSPLYENLYTLLTMSLAYFFVKEDVRKTFGIPDGHPVVCLVVGRSGEILSWAVNTIGKEGAPVWDLTRHAEVNALYAYFQNHPGAPSLPEGTRIFTSLKSCHMCAGAIHDSLGKNRASGKVVYGQNDPAQKNTAITDLERTPGEQLFQELDRAYSEEQEKDPTLNAAASLAQLQEHGKKMGEELAQILFHGSMDGDRVVKHIKSFLASIHLLDLLTKLDSQQPAARVASAVSRLGAPIVQQRVIPKPPPQRQQERKDASKKGSNKKT